MVSARALLRKCLVEELKVAIAGEIGFAEMEGLLRPNGDYLFVLPSEGSTAMNRIRTSGYGEDWDMCVADGGPPSAIIQSFLDIVEADLRRTSEYDAQFLDTYVLLPPYMKAELPEDKDPLGGPDYPPDVPEGVLNAFEPFDN